MLALPHTAGGTTRIVYFLSSGGFLIDSLSTFGGVITVIPHTTRVRSA